MTALALELEPRVKFAQVREDPDLEIELCRRLGRDGLRVLTIASGGCTALSLVAEREVETVDAVDANPAQIALCELKKTALGLLGVDGARAFLGDSEASPRWRLDRFGEVRRRLPATAEGFWADRLESVERGVLESGEFERLFACLRKFVHELVVPAGELERFFASGGREDGQELLDRMDSRYWQVAFDLFFHDRLLGAMFGSAAVQHAPRGSYPEYFRRATERAILEMPVRDNYFLSQILLGRSLPGPRGAPPYLRLQTGARVREGLDRVRFHAKDFSRFLEEPARPAYDLVSLSNVFDWMDDSQTESVVSRLADLLAPGGLVLLRQINNHRPLPLARSCRLVEDPELSRELLERDRSFFYGRIGLWRARP